MSRRAFTLVELLVVVAVMAVIALLLIPILGYVREQARWTVTTARIQDIQTSWQALDQAALALQRQAGLGGVTVFVDKTQAEITDINAAPNANNPYLSTPKAQILAEWLTQAQYDLPHYFGFPWEDIDRIQARSTPQLAAGTVFETQAIDAAGYQTVSISQLSPLLSQELLAASGALADAATDAYRTDRGTGKPWNDAWGRPLVVAFGLFQPPSVTAQIMRIAGTGFAVNTTYRDGLRISAAMREYGHARAVYLCVGAVGGALPSGFDESQLSDPSAAVWTGSVLPALWARANAACDLRGPAPHSPSRRGRA